MTQIPINPWAYQFDTSADAPAQRFLAALGKNGSSRIRGFLHKKNPLKGADKSNKKATFNPQKIEEWQLSGKGIYVVIGNGGDCDADITDIPAFFAEWDDFPVEEQLNFDWSNFLEPSMSVITLNSVHNYWILNNPISDIPRWENLTRRMIAILKSDKKVNNPSRVMRLPGCYYADGDGALVKPIELHSLTDKRYTVDEIEVAITREEERQGTHPSAVACSAPTKRGGSSRFSDVLHDSTKRANARPKSQILSALKKFPPRVPGDGTYGGDEPVKNSKGEMVHIDYFKAAVGCWKAFEYAGVSFDEAIEYMEEQHPLWSDIRQQIEGSGGVGKNGKPIEDDSFWKAARDLFGWEAPDKAPAEDDLLSDCDVMAETLKQNRATASEEFELMSVLPRTVAASLAARAQTFPVHESAMFAPFCTAIATAVGWRFKVQPKVGHTEPLVFWFANVQQLSSMKSPVGKEVTYEPLDFLQEADLLRYATERETYEQLIAMSEASKKSIPRLMQMEHENPVQFQNTKETAAEYLYKRNTQSRIRAFFRDPSCPVSPPRTAVTKDSTLEQLAALMAQPNNTGLLLYFDELARFMETMDQYRVSGGDRQQYLDLWSGSTIDVQRKESGRTYAKRTNLNMFGYIQPETLRNMLGAEKLSAIHGGDGFWARWLFCNPPHVLGLYNDLEGSVSDLMLEALDKIERNLANPSSEMLTFSPETFQLYRDTVNEWLQDSLDKPLGIQGMVSKLKGYLPRFAGLLHLIEWAVSDADGVPTTTIGVETMKRAISVCSYFRKQYEMVMTNAGTTGIPEWVTRLELKAESTKAEEVTTSQMTRWRIAENQPDANKKIEALVDDLCLGNRRKNRQNNWVWLPKGTNPKISEVMV